MKPARSEVCSSVGAVSTPLDAACICVVEPFPLREKYSSSV